mmetsp:Transcript_4445/g.10708  ORF Transcript_4445/g.10708 Transcript_4445/m.10708 type:complete len:232 (-) Transcript_4445:140-835(-)
MVEPRDLFPLPLVFVAEARDLGLLRAGLCSCRERRRDLGDRPGLCRCLEHRRDPNVRLLGRPVLGRKSGTILPLYVRTLLDQELRHLLATFACRPVQRRRSCSVLGRYVRSFLKKENDDIPETIMCSDLKWGAFLLSSFLLDICAVRERLAHLLCLSALRCLPERGDPHRCLRRRMLARKGRGGPLPPNADGPEVGIERGEKRRSSAVLPPPALVLWCFIFTAGEAHSNGW